MNKKLVSVIIPNYNGVDLLKKSLPSLKKQTFKDFQIVIVDNGSTDGSLAFIKKNYSNILVINLNENLGYSKAVNKGIERTSSELIFLLNNDTELEKNCLKRLVEIVQKKDVSFVVPKVLDFYNRNTLELAGNSFVIDAVGHLFSTCAGKNDQALFNREDFAFLAPGGAVLIKRKVFEKIGLFDEDFFMYLEDADLSLRAQWAGFKGWYNPKAVVYHIGRATSKKNFKMVELQNFRNMTLTIIKDFPIKLIVLNSIKIFLVHLNTLRYLISKGYLIDVVKTEIDIFKNLPNFFAKRKKVQNSKVVSDEYIIQNIYPKRFF